MEQMTSICDMVGQYMQKKEEVRRIAEDQTAKDRYWKILIRYDDDEDYIIAIIPVLSTNKPVDSLIMEDEHLDAIPATESDEVIKSSVRNLVPTLSESEGIPDKMCDDDDSYENIEYIEASPLNLEIDSLEEVNEDQEEKEFDLEDIFQIQDVILREKLLNISRLVTNIESLKDNPTPDRVLKSPSSFPIPIVDSDSFFKESDTSFSYQISLYLNLRLLAIIRKRREVAVPLLMLITIFPRGDEIDVEDDDSYIFVIRTFLPFLTYPVDSPFLYSFGSEDTIFDPDISI
ncbi:hypothetical protein Tco_0736148 [Tanacetum coccineum]